MIYLYDIHTPEQCHNVYKSLKKKQTDREAKKRVHTTPGDISYGIYSLKTWTNFLYF